MTGLKDTTAHLAARRRAAPAPARRMLEATDFGANPGKLRMLGHVPDSLPPSSPLVVVLHGCGQQAEAFAADGGWLDLAEQAGFAVLAPEQRAGNNPNRCFNWFNPGDNRRGEGEAASIHAMTLAMLRTHRLDPGRVFVTGLSAGGAMTAVMLAAYPETFAGGAVIAGVPYGVANSVREAMVAMGGSSPRDPGDLAGLLRAAAPAAVRPPRLAIWHGGADLVVNMANATTLAAQWALAHGLSPTPDETELLPGRSRSVWRAPGGGVLMELNLLPALGHGSPLATTGEHALGSTAPFMLEAGVSSTLEIARFWGVAETLKPAAEPAREPHPASRHPLGEQVMAALSDHLPPTLHAGLGKVLRGAGFLG